MLRDFTTKNLVRKFTEIHWSFCVYFVLFRLLYGEQFACPHNRGNITKLQHKERKMLSAIVCDLNNICNIGNKEGN
jgi:hypothetical protein